MAITLGGKRKFPHASILLGDVPQHIQAALKKNKANEPAKKFEVYVADNYHFMDSSEAYVQGRYDTWEEAVAIARRIVESSLPEYSPGTTADEMIENYLMFGDDPCVTPTPEGETPFSAWDYAKQLCAEICAEK